MNTFGSYLRNTESPQITANALKYCPCPHEAQACGTVFKEKNEEVGECRRELLICVFEGETLRMPSDLQTPQRLCEVGQGHEN